MNVALLAVDSTYPNIALMKISAYHKSQGDTVDWYNPFDTYDRLYMAKVFSFTPDYGYVIPNVRGSVVRGGTGYDIHSTLPDDIDRLQPDYSLYPTIDGRTSYGFLTRGCPNRCRWCVVPQKEGCIRPYMDIDDITLHGARPYAVLMDNNVLACDYGLSQIEKIAARWIREVHGLHIFTKRTYDYTLDKYTWGFWIQRAEYDTLIGMEAGLDNSESALEAGLQTALKTIIKNKEL